MSVAYSPVQRAVIDDAITAYVVWREACAAVWETYGQWWRAGSEDAACAHAAYSSALDREEAAANAYAKRIVQASEVFSEA